MPKKKSAKTAKKTKRAKAPVSRGEIYVKGNGFIRLWKIGSENRPATQSDIDAFQNKLKKCYEKGSHLVSHHAVQTELVGVEESQILMGLCDRSVISKEEMKERMRT